MVPIRILAVAGLPQRTHNRDDPIAGAAGLRHGYCQLFACRRLFVNAGSCKPKAAPVSWLLNLLSGLIAVLISAALLHFGGSAGATAHDPAPAVQPDTPRMPDAAPADDNTSHQD
jgi:hypothetical protein